MLESILKLFHKKPETPETSKTPSGLYEDRIIKVSDRLSLMLSHVVGFDGEYYCVKIKNSAIGKCPHWDFFSPRFSEYDDALFYLKGFLMPHNDLGKRRITFLESLMRNARQNHVESLYYYVRDMMVYFDDCLVEKKWIVEVLFSSQMTDLGDEYFDCLYSVNREIFGKPCSIDDVSDDFNFYFKIDSTGNRNPEIGKVLSKLDDGSGIWIFENIGSNHKTPLKIYIKLDLNGVVVDTPPKIEKD